MKKLNFLFATPKYVNSGEFYDFYLGIAYVSSYLRMKGFNVFCLNTNHYDEIIEEQLSKIIKRENIDVLCTGGMSFHYNSIVKILETAKKIKPDIINVVGGAIVVSDIQMAMENLLIDYGIIGEGEETLAELAEVLCNDGDVSKVKDIVYYDDDYNMKITEKKTTNIDLNTLPIPDYEAFEYGTYVKMFSTADDIYFSLFDDVKAAYISLSRSCPYKCTFCYHPLGKKYRQKSLDNVFKEIDYLVETYGINTIVIIDELFASSRQRVIDFAKRIKLYNIRWEPQLRVTDVDEELLSILKDAGVYCISYGIESANDIILKSMKKKTTVAQINKALELTRKAKIAIQGNIILGDPEETYKTATDSVNWCNKNGKFGINLNMIFAIPDSEVYQYALKSGIIKDKVQFMKDGFPVINLSKHLTDEEFEKFYSLSSISRVGSNYEKGKILDTKINDNKHFEISVECPGCNHVSVYKNMKHKWTRVYTSFICRGCYQHLRVNSQKCFPQDYSVLDKIYLELIKYGSILVKDNIIVRNLYYHVFKKYTDVVFGKFLFK